MVIVKEAAVVVQMVVQAAALDSVQEAVQVFVVEIVQQLVLVVAFLIAKAVVIPVALERVLELALVVVQCGLDIHKKYCELTLLMDILK